MSTTDVRVRFAPSPTGYLHVGGARTALFNWLFARSVGGKFLLRIEDTDRERSSEEHTRVILEGLEWLGLDWDEQPVFQGAGIERHQQLADRLLEEGRAYRDEGAVRFRMPQEDISWQDAVHGPIRFHGKDLNDLAILRSDRTPTYNFTVVCDDAEMGITHVLRGDDHISNTPKQLALYRALGYEPPTFAHVPMIHGTDGKKLSKRHGATAVGDHRHQGILPSAMRNFLALLGWNPGDEREVFYTAEELIEAFSLERIQKSNAVFDPQKLEWMNGQHLSLTPGEAIWPLVERELADGGLVTDESTRPGLLRCIDVVKERARTTHDLANRVLIRKTVRDFTPDDKANKYRRKNADTFHKALEEIATRLRGIEASQVEDPAYLDRMFRDMAESGGLKLGQVMQPVRIALTGETVSEPVTELVPLVGKEESLRRIEAALAWPEP